MNIRKKKELKLNSSYTRENNSFHILKESYRELSVDRAAINLAYVNDNEDLHQRISKGKTMYTRPQPTTGLPKIDENRNINVSENISIDNSINNQSKLENNTNNQSKLENNSNNQSKLDNNSINQLQLANNANNQSKLEINSNIQSKLEEKSSIENTYLSIQDNQHTETESSIMSNLEALVKEIDIKSKLDQDNEIDNEQRNKSTYSNKNYDIIQSHGNNIHSNSIHDQSIESNSIDENNIINLENTEDIDESIIENHSVVEIESLEPTQLKDEIDSTLKRLGNNTSTENSMEGILSGDNDTMYNSNSHRINRKERSFTINHEIPYFNSNTNLSYSSFEKLRTMPSFRQQTQSVNGNSFGTMPNFRLHSENKNGYATSPNFKLHADNNNAYMISDALDNVFAKHSSPTNATSYLDNEVMSIRSMMSRKGHKRFHRRSTKWSPTWIYSLFGILLWTFIILCIKAIDPMRDTAGCSTDASLRYWLCYISVAFITSFAEIYFEKRHITHSLVILVFNLVVLVVMQNVPLKCVCTTAEDIKLLDNIRAGIIILVAIIISIIWFIKKKSR